MLSILIPIFNFDIRPLVANLHGQCEALGIGYEILCFDDGSTPEFKTLNKEIWKLPNVIYREMPTNLGRSAIRNALGKAARFDYLLFMDCDSKVVSSDFIKKYAGHIHVGFFPWDSPNKDAMKNSGQNPNESPTIPPGRPNALVYGGRCYADTPPTDHAIYFHWYYGRYREQTTAAERSRSPYHGFMSNNFMVPKSIFLDIQFDETLRQYGHEDTLFGMELSKRGVPIIHIDNPLEHIGLESVDVFLKKTEQGIENLVKLKKEGKPIESRLLVAMQRCKKYRIDWLVSGIVSVAKPFMVQQLKSKNPNLAIFDLLKLGTILSLSEKNS